jgi:hypothetical protein
MYHGRQYRWLRPSPALVVAFIALIFAMAGSAQASLHLISGDSMIKKASLSGNRLRAHTVTGTQVNFAKLGKVPSAAQADSATSAGHAASADSATTASHAASADSATSAAHATNADSATNASHATSAGSAAPSGTAGGELSGSYPNPTIASGVVTSSKFAALPGAEVALAGASIPTGEWTTLTFSTAIRDVGNLRTTSNPNRLTAPVDGKYLIIATVSWDPATSGDCMVALFLNYDFGTPLAFSEVPSALTGYVFQTAQRVCHLSAGDTVGVQVAQTSGDTLACRESGGAPQYAPVLSMDWLGP